MKAPLRSKKPLQRKPNGFWNGVVQMCVFCGKSFSDPKHPGRTYCSRRCFFDHSKIWRKSEHYRAIAIKNLPKHGRGALNPNFRGDRAKIKAKLARFRKLILSRDKFCRDCHSSNNLECHHIVSFREVPEAAFMPMNGIALCENCHFKTDNYGGRITGREMVRTASSNLKMVCKVIPHRWREYDTIGNWSFTPEGILFVFVSDTGNDISNAAIIVHEQMEALLCRKHGVSEESVTNFDLKFEEERRQGKHRDDEEPGANRHAPYHVWHLVAERFERAFIEQAGMMWSQHERNCDSIK